MDQVAQVREKTDIVALISQFVPLKKTGRNFKATCPFHGEKTPSFVVSPERQIWHCFGCNRGGDCFSFLMQYENMEFPEALRELAKKAGIQLIQTAFQTGVTSKKEKIYQINQQAMEYYHYVLTSHAAGKHALSYVTKERGISDKVIKTFMVGFAPKTGNAVVDYLSTKKKHTKDDLVEAGIAFWKKGGISDFFMNRLMFPLFDHRGNIEGFSGRIMDSTAGSEQAPKYVNTRETVVYHKGSVFFGLNIAKDEIKKENRSIIMEGELDVLSSFQEGFGNAVAVKGTALTEHQVILIARFCDKVSLCFDSDKAGKAAIVRSLPALEKKGVTTSIIMLSNGKDPDEAIKNDPVAFKQAVKHDIPVYDYLLSDGIASVDISSADGKKQLTNELLPLLNNIENEIVKEHYFKKLAIALDTSYDSVVKQAERIQKQEKESKVLQKTKDQRLRREVLEEYILGLILQYKNPKEAYTIVNINRSGFSFFLPAQQKLCEYLTEYFVKNETFDSQMFLKTIPPELFSAFDHCYLLPIPTFTNDDLYVVELKKISQELYSLSLKDAIKSVADKIKEKEKTKDGDLNTLHTEHARLTALLSGTQK